MQEQSNSKRTSEAQKSLAEIFHVHDIHKEQFSILYDEGNKVGEGSKAYGSW